MQVAGAEVLVAETIRRLGPRLDPTVLCLDAVGALGERLQREGVAVVSLGRRPGRDYRMAFRMAREFRARRIQVVHAHQYTPFFYSALARIVSGGGPPLIFTEHGRHFPDVIGSTRRRLNQLLFSRLASEVNAVCSFSAQAVRDVEGFSRAPVGVIENGIDPERYAGASDRRAAKTRAGFATDRRYVATIARFHPVKDHRTLLDAFATVAAACPDVDLLLAGDGPQRADLEAQAARLGLAERVRFLGVRSDVPAILAAADVFCLTSVSEAASLTLLEAMASEAPVVVTGVGGNPEIVRDGVEGLLVPRQDPVATAAALIRVLGDGALAARLGKAGAARVRAVYRLDRTIQRYLELYQRLAAQ